MDKGKRLILGTFFKILILSVLILGTATGAFSQGNETSPLPKSPLKGSQVFIQKGCIKCHTIWGMGEAFGPDLTQIGRDKNFFELAGALWSHSPKMIEVMKEKNIDKPILSPEEIEQLMAYLYYMGFFDELGDYLKGEEIFYRKDCNRCHSIGGEPKKSGLSLDKYGQFVSPVYIATALWNHSSTISQVMVTKSFDPQEMSHLLVFIKGNALNKEGKIVYMEPGNPNEGRNVFRNKKCSVCHVKGSLDLMKSSLRRSLTEIVRMMWNHSYQMWGEIKQKSLPIPHFDYKEMADLMTYLYFISYYGEQGNPTIGEKIFYEKGCISCHSKEAIEGRKGLDLSEVSHLSIFELVSAMWNHVPEMEKMVTEMNLIWPRFDKNEMKDLIQYIQSLKK